MTHLYLANSRLFRSGLMLLTTVVVWGCTPPEKIDSKDISIRFKSALSDSFEFEMSNNSDREVTFKGWRQQDGDVFPLFSAGCTSQSADSTGPAVFVGPQSMPIDTQQQVTLAPSRMLQLSVPKSEFASQTKARCFVTVLLEDGTQLDSNEFEP